MFFRQSIFTILACLGVSTGAFADSTSVRIGGDTFFAGSAVSETVNTGGDTFIAARSAVARGSTQGDMHVAGFDISVDADTAQDLYAAGATVVVRGSTAQDLTVAGFSVRTEETAETGGNARLFGNTLTIDGPINGALLATASDVILNAPIGGDVRIVARTISFGPDAVVDGLLTYSTEDRISVPDRVAPQGRVVFQQYSGSEAWDDWDEFREDMPVLPTLASMMFGFVISLLFFLVLGALMLGFMPRRLRALRRSIAAAPGQSMLLGVIGLSVLFGMAPITALTIVGLPFVPIALLLIVVAWILGYALGAYSVAMRIWSGFGGAENPSNVARLAIFAAAITFIALLNFIPFVGWVANYTLILLGIGAMTRALFHYLIGNSGEAFDIDMKPIDD
ncbi:hypothetical protein [Litoreibacter roseus]|uniref:DUF8173 domain-containing protein n=1 Tax=Litoreibacter roseus TaxID=2601869 RepID=A0A6N6JHT6_9RHOB|nr:hypothetical protein [Litoreibacter roseus]GFE65497.1 hypothetical protein KIN_25710 [Litoreibacter roseus]